jgi:hypothetical protein
MGDLKYIQKIVREIRNCRESKELWERGMKNYVGCGEWIMSSL